MSSPKRWSVDPVNQEWRFQAGNYASAGEDPSIARAARRFINETGDVVRQIEAEEKAGLGAGAASASRARCAPGSRAPPSMAS